MMWWTDGGPGAGGWLAMSLMMLIFWGLLIVGGVALWRVVTRDERRYDERPSDNHTDAVRLLDERFARGEIQEDDYTHRRELLTMYR